MRERVLHRVPGPARLPVEIAPLPAAFLRGNDRFHSLFSVRARISSVSRPLSAKSFSTANPSIGAIARAQSAVAPRVTRALTGMPCASAARYDFVLSPPLRGSCPDYLLSRPPHVGEPCNDRHRSSAMRGPARHSEFQAVAPTPLSRQRMKRQRVSLHPPGAGSRSRHGASARITRKTALPKRRLSRAPPPAGHYGHVFLACG